MEYLGSIFGALRDRDKYVYHYTKARTAIDHIVNSGTLKFGSMLTTNDPKEVKDWQLFMRSRTVREDYPDLGLLSRQVTKLLKSRTFVGCFCSDGRLTGEPLNDIPQRGWARARMWAQYATEIIDSKVVGHKGVCLVYERSDLNNSIVASVGSAGFVTSGPVNYIDRAFGNRLNGPYGINLDISESIGLDKHLTQHAIEHADELFYEKGSDWSSEAEYRWVVISQLRDSPLISYGNSLRAVIIGSDCADSMVREVVDVCSPLNISVTSLDWVNGVPWRDFRFEEHIHKMKRTSCIDRE